MIEMARSCLIASGVPAACMNIPEIAAEAMQSTSDFLLIMADVANKTLRDAYEVVARSFTISGRRVEAADFRTRYVSQFGS